MKKSNVVSISLVITIALIIFIVGVFAMNYFAKKELSVEDTAKEFLTSWISYDGNPIVDRIYQNNPHVSNEFSQKLDDIIDSFETSAFDPVLCAQDIPSDITIVNTSTQENDAIITVNENFSGYNKLIEILLKKTGDTWLVNDIVCTEGEMRENLNDTVSPAIKAQVGDYIRENISVLSPEEAVLGGNFYVTSIRFTGPTSCIVEYEDGHIALTAHAEFTVPEAGNVKITSFELEDTINAPDFKKTGNLTMNAGNWQLLYEEPGKPALSVELEFDKNSLCHDSYEDKSCSSLFWEVGNRAEITGYQQGESVLVSSLKIVDKASKSVSGDLPITNFKECVAAGNEAMYPDCVGCTPYCETATGERFEELNDKVGQENILCDDLCGDGVCAEIVCMGEGCPCAETTDSCPQDCY